MKIAYEQKTVSKLSKLNLKPTIIFQSNLYYK